MPPHPPSPTPLRLLSRQWCHLCHEMEAALMPLVHELGLTVEVLDIDADPALEARWNEDVPVLLASDGRELCRHALDADAVRAWATARLGESAA